MPFLRRRGNMASETDMRRHSLLDTLAEPASKHPPYLSESAAELPGLTSVAEDFALPNVPPSPADHPRDSISVASSHAVPSIIEPYDASRSSGNSEYAQKQRRFSMLRFRNASDSQLAAKAKLHAAAEKPPPVPRRTCPSPALVVVCAAALFRTNTWNFSSRDYHHCADI